MAPARARDRHRAAWGRTSCTDGNEAPTGIGKRGMLRCGPQPEPLPPEQARLLRLKEHL